MGSRQVKGQLSTVLTLKVKEPDSPLVPASRCYFEQLFSFLVILVSGGKADLI